VESDLSLSRSKLDSGIGFFLGFGRGADFDEKAWTAKQTAAIDFCRESGLRQFYTPPVLGGVTHEWSFLRPVASLTLADADSVLVLPDDFGGLDGTITLTTDGSTSFMPVPVYGVPFVYAQYAGNTELTGRPTAVCQEPIKGSSQYHGQRWQLKFFPIADQEYTVRLRYYLLPNGPDVNRPFPYGGGQHSETIMASCIAAAELYQDDQRGPRWEYFMERLTASIAIDRRNKAQVFAYNSDNSDQPFLPIINQQHLVTFDGVCPE